MKKQTFFTAVLTIFFSCSIQLYAQFVAGGRDSKDEWTNAQHFDFTVDDDNSNDYWASFSWWVAGGNNTATDLMMQLQSSKIKGEQEFALNLYGEQKIYDRKLRRTNLSTNLHLFVDHQTSHIQSNGDTQGMKIASMTGNKVYLGDHDDAVNINAKQLTLNYGGVSDLAQVSINTNTQVHKAALTVGGMTYIGSSKVIESHPEIGDSLQEDCSLFVEKQILASDLNIIPKKDWADHVFESNYKKMSLTNLEAYVKKNRHLPNMVSAKEVAEKGYKTHEFNKNLLKTVEELTLHIISQNKKIEMLEKLISTNKVQ